VNEGAFSPFFQPIVDLDTEQVVGHEALTRFSDGTPPNVVFDLARSAGMSVELEIATLTAAVDASRVLPATAYVGLNVSPALLERVICSC
jgi:EAL domain-containing protein (putative c-di-GMP-specific phosphodiesterase class I)